MKVKRPDGSEYDVDDDTYWSDYWMAYAPFEVINKMSEVGGMDKDGKLVFVPCDTMESDNV